MIMPAPGGSAAPPPAAAAALMARVAAGDAAAFTLLVRQLQRPAMAIALRTLDDRAAAEDACQQAFTRLWTHAAHYDPARGPLQAWFRRILVNLCLDRRRSIRAVQPLDAAAAVADAAPDPEHRVIAADRQRRLDAAMARLNPRQRAALMLFHGQGLSMAEIAAELETTAKAVEGLLGRARRELRTMMNQTVNESLPT